MSSAEGVDIDLYGSDIEHDINRHFEVGDEVELYGELEGESNKGVVSAVNGGEGLERADGIPPRNKKKYQACVGGLTWWTTDKNLMETLAEIGVNDSVSVKFYENRTNGQSKGYCILTVESEVSMRAIYDLLPKTEIHGKIPIVTPPTKWAMFQFDAQMKPQEPMGMANGGGNVGMGGPRPRGPMGLFPLPHRMAVQFGGPRMIRCGPGMSQRQLGPQNNPCGPPRGFNCPTRAPPPSANPQNTPPGFPFPPPPQHPQMQQQQPPYFIQGGGPGPQGMPPRGPPMGIPMSRGPPPTAGEWTRSPVALRMNGAPLPPHGNPAFFNQPGSPAGPPGQHGPPLHFGGPHPSPIRASSLRPPSMDLHEPSPELNLSDGEFEEVMSRNRSVSSSAISRAVADAASGEFASAIETLVTAVSLIRQSKVASDGRCQILVSALQDTLHGIESNSYPTLPKSEHSRSRERERGRSRRRRRDSSRSKEREDYGNRKRVRYYDLPRERSRSKEREYRESGTAGNRFYEDRERVKRSEGREQRRGGDSERNREGRY